MLKIKQIEYFKSFSDCKNLPKNNFTEIAFIGRSNVGKSSLINDICGKKIAQTSSTPGKTRLINYFIVNKNFYFIDLPGYGFAKISKEQKKTWPVLIENYLTDREQLKIILFLFDIRRTPNEEDIALSEWLANYPDRKIIYILTKSDKLSKSDRNLQAKKIKSGFKIKDEDTILYSVLKNLGKNEVLKKLDIFNQI